MEGGVVPESAMETVTRTLANVKDMQTHLKDFLSISNPEVVAQLPPLQRAQAHLLLAKATTTLFALNLRCKGVNPDNHPVKSELERLRLYEVKLERLMESNKEPLRPSTVLNHQAATRFIEHSLPELTLGKMSKADHIKPTTKESYAMPKAQTSNRFEVLGKIPKPNTPSSSNPIYLTKEPKLLIQVLEADHQFAPGSFEPQNFFQKDKYFITNEISKTRRFYEFILVDTESIQVSHVKNPEGTDIAYSKCKILKVISEKDWEQSPFTHKRFSENFVPQTFDYMDYKNAWYNTFFVRPSSHSWFFNWGEKLQKVFPNWFQEWWLFLGATQNIFCPEIRKSFDYFKANCENFFPSGNSYSLSFCSQFRIPWILCWELTSHHFLPTPFPQHLAREFKIKWWTAFKISQAQTFESIKGWLDAQKPKSKKPTKSKVPTWTQPLLGPLIWPQTPSKNSFPSNSAYKAYLKKVQKQVAETLSQLVDSDSDEEDTASSSAFQQNEDMCYGLPYTPLE